MKLGKFQLSEYNIWYSIKELKLKGAVVVGEYVKILGPFGYKKYYGDKI